MSSLLFVALIGGMFGALVGWGGLLATVLIARNGGTPYDEQRLSSDADVHGIVERWASANGYERVDDHEGRRVYRKGKGLVTAPMFLEVSNGPEYIFRSYTRFNALVMKADMALGGGGFVGVVPRNLAKKAQNTLFAELGLPGIA